MRCYYISAHSAHGSKRPCVGSEPNRPPTIAVVAGVLSSPTWTERATSDSGRAFQLKERVGISVAAFDRSGTPKSNPGPKSFSRAPSKLTCAS
jgi:hypothetical protein